MKDENGIEWPDAGVVVRPDFRLHWKRADDTAFEAVEMRVWVKDRATAKRLGDGDPELAREVAYAIDELVDTAGLRRHQARFIQ